MRGLSPPGALPHAPHPPNPPAHRRCRPRNARHRHVTALPASALAQERSWRHGLSLFGDLKYPAGFKNFDYVNVNAPKGGAARLIAFGTFDNFNLVPGGVKGSLAAGSTRSTTR